MGNSYEAVGSRIGWRSVLILLVAVAASAAGPGSAPAGHAASQPASRPAVANEPFGWTVYSAEEVAVALPPELAPRPAERGGVLEAEESDPRRPTRLTVVVHVVDSPPEATLEAHFLQTSRDLSRTLELYEPRAYTKVDLPAGPAFLFEFFHRIGPEGHTVRMAGILCKPRFVLVSCGAREGAFPNLHEDVELILQNVRVATTRPASAPAGGCP